MKASIHETKSQLSKLLKLVSVGEEVIVTHGRNHRPVAKIVGLASHVPVGEITTLPEFKDGKRPIGLFAKEMSGFPEYDWDEPMSDEELALWEAPIVSTWADNDGTPKTQADSK